MSEAKTLADEMNARVEPWMDVLLVGLSPELFVEGHVPRGLATARAGRNLPRRPWDAVIVKGSSDNLERSGHDVRAGGFLALVTGVTEKAPVVSSAVAELVETVTLNTGEALWVFRRTSAGTCDHVGIRRHWKQLIGAPERLEILTRDVLERDAMLPAPPDGLSMKELIGRLADVDRCERHPRIARLLNLPPNTPPFPASEPPPLHGTRLLTELVTRFRHFRTQAAEFLDNALPGDLTTLDPAVLSALASELRAWTRDEEAVFLRLEALRQRSRVVPSA